MADQSYESMRASSLHFWPAGFPIALKYNPQTIVDLQCTKQIADDSLDHLEPRGTAHDNTHWLPFVAKCEQIFGYRDLRYLDLGCAGGGLVFDFAVRRHFAIGLEGSDYSLRTKRAEWATIPDNLFTCDITETFSINHKGSSETFSFDVVGIWDALEHLHEERLGTFFDNVVKHLDKDGLFCGTVATRPASASTSGRNYHATVKPRDWWEGMFHRHGFEAMSQPLFSFDDFPRGNGIIFPANFAHRPEDGFHFVLKRRST